MPFLPESCFTPRDVVAFPAQKIELKDSGEIVEVNVYVRKLAVGPIARLSLALKSTNLDIQASYIYRVVAEGICDEKGAPVMTVEQAAQLRPEVSMYLQELVMRVNLPEKKTPTASTSAGSSGSGTPSP